MDAWFGFSTAISGSVGFVMKRKVSITIGIPAYNEEANVGHLLKEVLQQETDDVLLEAILVISDGSTDRTVDEVKKIGSKLIRLAVHKDRRGKAYRVNQITEQVNSDVLVVLDADTKISDKKFVAKLIKPVVKRRADLTSARIEELPPQTLVEKILKASMVMKTRLYEKHKNGISVYTCHGRARAFSKRLYKNIRFASSASEDAFSYLFCISHGWKYEYVKNTKIFYRLPATFKDHEGQSVRFFVSIEELKDEFGKEMIKREYALPKKELVKILLKLIVYQPLIVAYLAVVVVVKAKRLLFKVRVKDTWRMAKSSKVLARCL